MKVNLTIDSAPAEIRFKISLKFTMLSEINCKSQNIVEFDVDITFYRANKLINFLYFSTTYTDILILMTHSQLQS